MLYQSLTWIDGAPFCGKGGFVWVIVWISSISSCAGFVFEKSLGDTVRGIFDMVSSKAFLFKWYLPFFELIRIFSEN